MTRQPTPANILDNVLTADVAPDRTALRSRLRWDYAQVAPVDRKAVEDAAVDILANGQRMQQSAVAVGERLIAVKRLLGHGQFGDWCQTEFSMSQKTAENLMNVAREFGDKIETVSIFTNSAMYLLAAPSTPEPARQQAIAEAQATGKSPTKERVREIIAEHKPGPAVPPIPAPKPVDKYAPTIFVNELQAIVSRWSKENWAGEWPENPSHTNGTFWRDITAWLHANDSRPWREGDLKAAIKEIHGRKRTLAAKESAEHSGTPAITTRQAADILRPTVEAFYADEDSRRYRVPDMQAAAQTNSGGVWRACERALANYTYTSALLMAALRLIADELKQSEPSTSSTPSTPSTDAKQPGFVPIKIADDRIPRCRRLIGIYNQAISVEDEYGDLTGCYSETTATKRELQKLIDRLQRTIDLLEGKAVAAEECD